MARESVSLAEHEHRIESGELKCRRVGRRQVKACAPAIDEDLSRLADLLSGSLERGRRVDVADVTGDHRVVDRVRDLHCAVSTTLVALHRGAACPLAEQIAGVAQKVLDRPSPWCDECRQVLLDRHRPPLVSCEQTERPLGPQRPGRVEEARMHRRRDGLVELRERRSVERPRRTPGEGLLIVMADFGQLQKKRFRDAAGHGPGQLYFET
jgi:hypothetical protein